jgi:transcriptional regulator with XRE-family HTH domain
LIVGKLRLETGLTHEQLVPIAGISTRILQRIERGANASRKRLKHIASVLENNFENLWIAQEMPTAEQPNFPRLSAEKKDAMEYVSDSRHSSFPSLSPPRWSLPLRS